MSSKLDEARTSAVKAAVPIAQAARTAIQPLIVPTSLLVLGLVCFFLPFAELKRGDNISHQLFGRELVLGTEILRRGTRRYDEFQAIGGFQISAWVAVIGLIAAFVNRKAGRWVSVGAATLSTVSLILGCVQLNTYVLNKSEGTASVSFQFGFYAALVIIALATIKYWELATGRSFRNILPSSTIVPPTDGGKP